MPIGREGTMILGGLGDMPDSQGPNMAEKHIGTGVSDPHSSQASLPSGTNIGRVIINGCIYHVC